MLKVTEEQRAKILALKTEAFNSGNKLKGITSVEIYKKILS